MPSAIGYVTEHQREEMDRMLEEGRYDNESDMVADLISYGLKHKHSIEP